MNIFCLQPWQVISKLPVYLKVHEIKLQQLLIKFIKQPWPVSDDALHDDPTQKTAMDDMALKYHSHHNYKVDKTLQTANYNVWTLPDNLNIELDYGITTILQKVVDTMKQQCILKACLQAQRLSSKISQLVANGRLTFPKYPNMLLPMEG